jgi:hypothetical protein
MLAERFGRPRTGLSIYREETIHEFGAAVSKEGPEVIVRRFFRGVSLAVLVVAAACGASPATPGLPEGALNSASNENNPVVSVVHLYGGLDSDRIPIVLDLFIEDTSVEGSYYYTRFGSPIGLRGVLNRDGSFEFLEVDRDGEETARFVGRRESSGEYIGSWTGISGTGRVVKTFDFSAWENPSVCVAFRVVSLQEARPARPGDTEMLAEFRGDGLEPVALHDGAPRGALESLRASVTRFQAGAGENDPLPLDDGLYAYFRQARDSFFADYFALGVDEMDSSLPDSIWRWAESSRTRVVLNEAGLLVLENDIYGYRGGAHGIYSSHFGVFDVNTGKRLEKSDVLVAGADGSLKRIVRNRLSAMISERLERPADDFDFIEASAEDFPVTKNFFVCRAGVVFHYNVYDVTSYALGDFSVFVPWNEIRSLIRNGSPVERLLTPVE